MSLSSTLEQIKKSLGRADHAYAEGRARQPALAPFESPSAVLAAVDRGSPLTVAQRDAVLLCLLDEVKRTPRALWQSLLLVAFAPMLMRFRKGLRRPGCENLDQRVLVAFLETARSFPHTTYVQRNLRLGTRARIIAARHREERGSDLELFDDDTYAADVFAGSTPTHLKAETAEVIRIIEATGGQALRDALLARIESDATMKAYVDQEHPELGARQRDLLCDRLRRAEQAVLRKVRARATRRGRIVASAA
jgi:hypothetical protein